ncbi:MAG: P63C domain-containing protein [Terriglobales bacterium]
MSNVALGFKAEILPLTCQVFIDAFNAGVLSNKQIHIAEKCRSLVKGFAIVGITALIDEATGYQEIRDRKALEQILDRYLRKAFAAWAKRFPDEFYQQIFRLRGWQWRGMKVNRPGAVAGYTKDLVYARLAPGVLAKLEELNPIEDGHRRVKHHQYLTDDIGHPALQSHLNGVTAIMRGSTTWEHATRMIQRAFPKINTNLDLPFPDNADAE